MGSIFGGGDHKFIVSHCWNRNMKKGPTSGCKSTWDSFALVPISMCPMNASGKIYVFPFLLEISVCFQSRPISLLLM